VEAVPGDVVECGVGRGTSLTTIAGLLIAGGHDRRLWGFDSFEGFPDPSDHDTGFRRPRRGQWAVSTPDEIRRLLVWNGIPAPWCDQHLRLVKGFFSPALFARLAERPIALLHLDVDLYDSYRICLHELYARVSPGGVIAFDEYHDTAERWPGAVTAIDEFLAESGEQIEQDPLGKWFLVKQA
jgi:O-methyltransferase